MNKYLKVLFFGTLLCWSFVAHTQEYGVASYYADDFQGKETASGERYNKNKLTGAHKTLEYGTVVKVTRIDNDKSVQVRINDRGPFIKGRVVEVSKKAAEALDLINAGTAKVKVEVVGKGKVTAPPIAPPIVQKTEPKPTKKPKVFDEEIITPPAVVEETVPAKTPETSTNKEIAEVIPPKPKVEKPTDVEIIPPKEGATVEIADEVVVLPPTSTTEPRINEPKERSARLVKGQDYKKYDLYKIELLRPKKQGFGVQVASLNNHDYMLKQVASLQEKYFKNILVSIEKSGADDSVYKVILGPFPDMATAESYKSKLRSRYKIKGFVVNLANGNY